VRLSLIIIFPIICWWNLVARYGQTQVGRIVQLINDLGWLCSRG